MLKVLLTVVMLLVIGSNNCLFAAGEMAPKNQPQAVKDPNSYSEYVIGVDDVLGIHILKPEVMDTEVTVAPDGSINYPYIGNVYVKGRSILEVQDEIQSKLSDGYMKYPVVTVYLQKSLSRKYFVYGEVIKPGPYTMDDNMTVLKAISSAGGFTKFGSSSRVKILRAKKNKNGYEVIEVNVKQILKGNTKFDVQLVSNDIVVVSEGIF